VAAQDQAISTNYFKNKILKDKIENKCWLCKQHEVTIDRLTSGCPILVRNEYLMIHDKVGAHSHNSICNALGFKTTDKWHTRAHTHTHTHVHAHAHTHTHTHTHKPVCEYEDVTMLWNQGLYTDTAIIANKPDIIIKN
jgi:hypothetical protein